MSRHRLAPQFLRDFRAVEPGLSPADQSIVDGLLAEAIRRPETTRRIQSFYDPDRSSWLLRSGPFLLHYAVDEARDEVVLLNLFRRR